MLFLKSKVTVGVCVKNAEKTIRDAINSVICQDFSHELMEIIVVDGQSEDKTLAIIKEILSEIDMRSVILSENKGLGVARQMVVDNANGDCILWVDGDMILSKDYVRKLVEFMDINPEVGIVIGSHGILPEANLVAALEDVAYVAVDFKFRGNHSLRLPGTAGAIFRVEAVRRVGGFDSRISGVGEDIEVAYRIRKSGWRIYRGAEPVFYEKRKENWKELWDHYFWYGVGSYKVYCKSDAEIKILYMAPFVGFLLGVWYSIIAYRILRRKFVFLLPLHYAFKRFAWFFGFIEGQIEIYKQVSPMEAKIS